MKISQNQEPPKGWPRYPRFNEPGDIPGPPVQFREPVTNANVKAGYGFIPNGVEEKDAMVSIKNLINEILNPSEIFKESEKINFNFND